MSTEDIQLRDIQKKREEKRQLKLKTQSYFENKVRTQTSVSLTVKTVSDQVQGRAKATLRPTTTAEPFAHKSG